MKLGVGMKPSYIMLKKHQKLTYFFV